MPKLKRPLSPAAAIVSLASPLQPVPMKDAEVRVGFYADTSLVCRAIGFFGGEFWGHMTNFVSADEVIDARDSATILPDPHIAGKSLLIHPGVQRRPASYLNANPYALVIAIPCTSQQRAGWIKDLEGQLDQRYDTAGIKDFLTDRIADPNWRGQRHPWFCDELGIWALQKQRIVRPLVVPPYRRTPGAASDVCMATEDARIVSYRGQLVEDMILAAGITLHL